MSLLDERERYAVVFGPRGRHSARVAANSSCRPWIWLYFGFLIFSHDVPRSSHWMCPCLFRDDALEVAFTGELEVSTLWAAYLFWRVP